MFKSAYLIQTFDVLLQVTTYSKPFAILHSIYLKIRWRYKYINKGIN